MTDKRISELTQITGADVDDANDELAIVDTSASETKAITRAELFTSIDGDITLSGTVDGRDVAADGTKLDTIETNADVTDTANVTAAGALMDSELSDITAVKALDQGVATTDDPTFTNTQLAAIAESKAVTAVDVFVYDTSKDSDGGAWRKRTQHTSWYNETLNTATRGSRREFPAVAVIVAEANKVTIYDGDDPSLPMWMVFNENGGTLHTFWYTGRNASSVSAFNAQLFIGSDGDTWGALRQADFAGDRLSRREDNGLYGHFPVSERNVEQALPVISTAASAQIVNVTVNDVAMTVLPDAPIDPATGLPVPTIAVATDGGTSVITDSGDVYDSARTDEHQYLAFTSEGLWYGRDTLMNFATYTDIAAGDGFGDIKLGTSGYPLYAQIISRIRTDFTNVGDDLASCGNVAPLGFQLTGVKYDDIPQSLTNLITSTYNTGWMNGDIKGAFLSDTDDTDLVGGTDADRSVNGNDLTVNGTVTRSPVATGADLVAYSGFSASNYLEQPYNSDLDFGTGDFCVMGWVKATANGNTMYAWTRSYFDGSSWLDRLHLRVQPTGELVIQTNDGAVTTDFSVNSNWQHFTLVRSGSTTKLYLNGVPDNSNTISGSGDVGTSTETTFIVGGQKGSGGFGNPLNGSLALLRISATAPTAEQIAKIYNDEKVLFQENAQATLYGASDAVTALAHDPVTDLLHVGTSAGRSVFSGLRRVDNTTTAVGTAISASNNLVVDE